MELVHEFLQEAAWAWSWWPPHMQRGESFFFVRTSKTKSKSWAERCGGYEMARSPALVLRQPNTVERRGGPYVE